MSRSTSIPALLLLACLASACRTPLASTPPASHAIRYRLAWDANDAKHISGATFETTTDRGYRLRLRRGYLSSYSMELVECPKEGTPVAALGALLWSAVEGTAHAGHASGTPNPAAIQPMQVESLTAPTARDAGTAVPPPQSYCQLHYLIARASAGAPGLPAEIDMVGASLHLEGTYRAPGAAEEIPFTVHTAIANGVLLERSIAPSAPIRVESGHSATRITIRRHLAEAFDGIDFAAVPQSALAGRVLQALVDHVDVEIEPADEDA